MTLVRALCHFVILSSVVALAACNATQTGAKAGKAASGPKHTSSSPEGEGEREMMDFRLRLDVGPDAVREGRDEWLKMDRWILPNEIDATGSISPLHSQFESAFGGEEPESEPQEKGGVLIRLHPLTRYDVWSRLVYTAHGISDADVHSTLEGEGYDDFVTTESRRYESTANPKRRELELQGFLKEGSSENEGSGGRGEAGSRTVRIEVRPAGFQVISPEGPVSPLEGCSKAGVTVCSLRSGDENVADLTRARRAVVEGEAERAIEKAEQLLDAYDYRRLYSVVAGIDAEQPQVNWLQVTATPEMPAFLITELADHLEIQLPRRSYPNRSAYQVARAQVSGGKKEALFPIMVLELPIESSANPSETDDGAGKGNPVSSLPILTGS